MIASLLPLLSFGILSVYKVRQATMKSVLEGHQNISQRASEQIEQYVMNAIAILHATAENINHAGLENWQEERILENYISQFDMFNELTLFDDQKQVVATTDLKKRSGDPYQQEIFSSLGGDSYISPVYIKEDLSPALRVSFPVKKLSKIVGILEGEVNLMQMWYLVDHIKIGESGFLNVLDADGKLIATGHGERKKEIFLNQKINFEKMLVVNFRMGPPLNWSVFVEQPESEAYALAHQMSILLVFVMALFIVLALGGGIYLGRKQVIDPIQELMQATYALSSGNLDYQLSLSTEDEFEVLAEAFNDMVVKLKEIQKKLIIEERHALFGRVASGLAHDLKHPIQAIETVSRLMGKKYDEAEFRLTFHTTVEREFSKLNQFLTDLHNLVHEVPFHPIPIHLNHSLQEALATFESHALDQTVSFIFLQKADPVYAMGDRMGLNRVFSNLISNAIQAMPHGGTLQVALAAEEGKAVIEFRDTGLGIPPERLQTLFEDFATTKPKGLGLGLPIIKKIVGIHQGALEVESVVGQGTCFRIKFNQVVGEKLS